MPLICRVLKGEPQPHESGIIKRASGGGNLGTHVSLCLICGLIGWLTGVCTDWEKEDCGKNYCKITKRLHGNVTREKLRKCNEKESLGGIL